MSLESIGVYVYRGFPTSTQRPIYTQHIFFFPHDTKSNIKFSNEHMHLYTCCTGRNVHFSNVKIKCTFKQPNKQQLKVYQLLVNRSVCVETVHHSLTVIK